MSGRAPELPAVETTPRPCWIAGHPEQGGSELTVRYPYDDTEVATVAIPTAAQVERAVVAADEVAEELRNLPARDRAHALENVARELLEHAEEIAETITAESGKPLKFAEIEVTIAANTLRFAAQEALRMGGQLRATMHQDGDAHWSAALTRVPRGPVLGLTPFEFPLALPAGKIAATLAVGAPAILRPTPTAPLSALTFGELLAESGLPDGAFSVLPLAGHYQDDEVTVGLIADRRLPVVSFTGAPNLASAVTETAPHKHLVLEFNGVGAAVVCADWSSDAQLEHAAQRVASFDGYQEGRSSAPVRRVFVHREIYDRFLPKLVSAVGELKLGDAHDPNVDLTPLADAASAARVEQWISEAVNDGAELHLGGSRHGNAVEPTVLSGVRDEAKLLAETAFGPALVVTVVDSLDDAVKQLNNLVSTESLLGLRVGLLTGDLETAAKFSRALRADSVIVGDVPSPRAGQLPYHGNDYAEVGPNAVRDTMDAITRQRSTIYARRDL